MRKKLNNKGFTLIELLAVIVILGILMLVAIPQVTKYIEQSRRDTFADTAKAYINGARYMYLNDEIDGCTVGNTATINIKDIHLENSNSSNMKSSFGGPLVGKVTITATKNNGSDTYEYTYKISIQDSTKKWGINDGEESSINRKAVEKLTENIDSNVDTTCS